MSHNNQLKRVRNTCCCCYMCVYVWGFGAPPQWDTMVGGEGTVNHGPLDLAPPLLWGGSPPTVGCEGSSGLWDVPDLNQFCFTFTIELKRKTHPSELGPANMRQLSIISMSSWYRKYPQMTWGRWSAGWSVVHNPPPEKGGYHSRRGGPWTTDHPADHTRMLLKSDLFS